ncbi:MAG: hypothetical protein HEQ23_11805 [Tepidisphaera sp.]
MRVGIRLRLSDVRVNGCERVERHVVALPDRDPDSRAEVRANLSEIATRGETDAWKDWARLQIVKLDGGR